MDDLNFDTKKKSDAESDNKKMFRSRFDFFVLNALNEHDGESYGYDVITYIQNKTKGHYKIKTYSTIYNTLKRLEEQNYVVSGKGDGETNGATRVYYTLTPEGKEYLEQSKKEYIYLRTLLDNLISDEDFDLENEAAPYNASNLKPLTKRVRENKNTDFNKEIINEPQISITESTLNFDNNTYNENENVQVVQVNDNIEVVQVSNSEPILFKNEEDDNTADKVAVKSYNDKKDVASTNDIETSKTLDKIIFVPDNNYKDIIERITKNTISPTSTNLLIEKKENNVYSEQTDKKEEKKVEAETNISVEEKQIIDTDLSSNAQTDNETEIVINNAPTLLFENANEKSNLDMYKLGVRSEGYFFNTFISKEETHSRYVYTNKLLRDSLVLSSLYMIIVSLVLFLLRNTFGFSITSLLIFGGIAIMIALISILIWFRNPEKRRKDRINLKIINLSTIGFFTVFFLLDLIITLLLPNGKGISLAEIYSPVLMATVVVFFGIIISILYKSDNYFVE